MHERKQLMFELSDAFVAMPGGLGTLEEVLEIATWAQLGLHRKPIGILDVLGYYGGLTTQLDHAALSGFLTPRTRGLLLRDDGAARLLDRLAAHAVTSPPLDPRRERRFATQDRALACRVGRRTRPVTRARRKRLAMPASSRPTLWSRKCAARPWACSPRWWASWARCRRPRR